MKNLLKRLKRIDNDTELASKSKVKLKLGPRYKFWKFHLYRRILTGLPIGDFDDFFTNKNNWKPKGSKFGEHKVTWNEWHTRINKVCAVQYYCFQKFEIDLYRWFKIPQIIRKWYYLKCLFWHRFNVLKIKTLPPTWSDEDRLLMHAMFAVLTRFMEQQPEELHDYELEYKNKENCSYMTMEEWEKYAAPRRLFWKEISATYSWWNEYVFFQNELDNILNGKQSPYTYEMVSLTLEEFEKQEDEKLQIILKHRGALWC